jgi:hypothetical protein
VLSVAIFGIIEAEVLHVATVITDEEKRDSNPIHVEDECCNVPHRNVPASQRIVLII